MSDTPMTDAMWADPSAKADHIWELARTLERELAILSAPLPEPYLAALRKKVAFERNRAEDLERGLLEAQKDAVDGWDAAVDWAEYASEYFRKKHGYEEDCKRLAAARAALTG